MQVIGILFEVAKTEDNKWAAIRSHHTPKFYIEGDSAEEVARTAEKALEFYLQTGK